VELLQPPTVQLLLATRFPLPGPPHPAPSRLGPLRDLRVSR
jgi:hypothetical protein